MSDDFAESASAHTILHLSDRTSARIEVVTVSGRREWTVEQKLAMLRDAPGPGGSVRNAAERYRVGTGSLYTWRRRAMSGQLGDYRGRRSDLCRGPDRVARAIDAGVTTTAREADASRCVPTKNDRRSSIFQDLSGNLVGTSRAAEPESGYSPIGHLLHLKGKQTRNEGP